MASMLSRVVPSVIRRTCLLTSARMSGGHPTGDPHTGKMSSDKMSLPDTMGHSVGPERHEQLAKLAGNEDPFELQVQPRTIGTKEEPTLVPSDHSTRVVGCICEDDALAIKWMYLNKGEAKRCACGFWFKLVAVELKTDFGQ